MGKLFFVYVLGLGLLAGCGKTDDPTPAAAAAGAGITDPNRNFQGGACGAAVVGDYRSLSRQCRFMRTREDAAGCRRMAESFLRDYPGVNCEIADEGRGGGGAFRRRIEAREIEELLERLRRIRM